MAAFSANVLVELADALANGLPGAVVETTTKRFVEIAEGEAARAGMATISPGGYGPYALTAQLKSVSVSSGYAEMTFWGYPVAFWVWAEEGTRAHMIRPRVRTRSEKGLYRAAMAGGLGHPITTEVWHPGVNGRAAWSHTVDLVDEEFGNIIDEAALNLDLWG